MKMKTMNAGRGGGGGGGAFLLFLFKKLLLLYFSVNFSIFNKKKLFGKFHALYGSEGHFPCHISILWLIGIHPQ